ncbi:MAG: hypothetical protein P8Y63_15455 [Deltaproteobacteria bacterium]
MMKQGVVILALFLLISGATLPDYGDSDDYEVPVILLVQKDEIRAFSGLTGNWVSLALKIGERLVDNRADGNIAFAVTNQRALGFSALTGLWAAVDLEIGESLRSIEFGKDAVAVLTNKRVLGFSAQTGMWVAETLPLYDGTRLR